MEYFAVVTFKNGETKRITGVQDAESIASEYCYARRIDTYKKESGFAADLVSTYYND